MDKEIWNHYNHKMNSGNIILKHTATNSKCTMHDILPQELEGMFHYFVNDPLFRFQSKHLSKYYCHWHTETNINHF